MIPTMDHLAAGEGHPLLHRLMSWLINVIGSELGTDIPAWMHPILHIVLIWGPLAFALFGLVRIFIWLRRRRRQKRSDELGCAGPAPSVRGIEPGIFGFVLRWSRRQQIVLVLLGLIAMPLLYATLELPKLIVNNAIDSAYFPVEIYGLAFDQLDYLFGLCALYLFTVLASGALKFWLNVYKGRVGERLLRRLRLTIYRRWHEGAGGARRGEAIPLIAQEVEPMGGFAADAFALPMFQGGVFATILVFMFVQDPILGAAALTLLPVQLALIPRLQARVNRLARQRVAEIRELGGRLGEEAGGTGTVRSAEIALNLKRIEAIRLKIHHAKFFMKALNNFLTALTPFFFYSIGGYLVIEGRLSLGALIAVLAAYKDFSAPLRELFRYYQQAEDVRVRYSEMLAYLVQKRTGVRCIEPMPREVKKNASEPKPAIPRQARPVHQ